MVLVDGTYQIGSHAGQLLLKTSRTGVGARAGHDLTIEATTWHGSVVVSATDPAQSSVSVDVEVASLVVREGSGGVKPLTDSDRAEIKRNIEKILDVGRHPAITFRSSRIDGSPESLGVEGELTIAGTAHPITVQAAVDEDGRSGGHAVVVQSRWGIKPYSAFLGALKLADEVQIEFDVKLTAME